MSIIQRRVSRTPSNRRPPEVAEKTYRLLVESVRDYAIFMLDVEGHVQSWNNGAEILKQYRFDEIAGKSIEVFYTPEDRATGLPKRLLAEAKERGRVDSQGWRCRKDGSRFWADVVITAVFDEQGVHAGFAKVTRDLTERRKLEEERLHRAHAEEAVRLRDEFLAIASHEFKTPLTSLLLQLQGLQKTEALDPPTRTKVARALRAASRMKELIESLLDISRISTGQFTLRPQRIDLANAVDHVVESMRPAAEAAGCSLTATIEAPLEGTWDLMRMEQVTMNLLSNAVKYASGTRIEVTLSRQGGDAVLVVRDHGPGIPPNDLARVFGRFERADRVKNYGGLGLGLYVTREIAQAHGGDVIAMNERDGGARLTVRVPVSPGMFQSRAAAATEGKAP
jgi:PAS domain S-box-containing protein